jgi:hypothetical protein
MCMQGLRRIMWRRILRAKMIVRKWMCCAVAIDVLSFVRFLFRETLVGSRDY